MEPELGSIGVLVAHGRGRRRGPGDRGVVPAPLFRVALPLVVMGRALPPVLPHAHDRHLLKSKDNKHAALLNSCLRGWINVITRGGGDVSG